MPIIPFAGAVGAALGTSAAVGGTIVAGTALATGLAVADRVASSAQASKAKNAGQAATQQANVLTPATTVGDVTPNKTSYAENLGRAALISTSPSGVVGTDPTGRRRLIGND